MSEQAVLVSKIWQVDNTRFAIEWSDGSAQQWRLCDLQRNCPCAGCTDEVSGKRLVDPKSVTDELAAVKVESVGRYGLRVQFSSGCSNGIYGFRWLRECGQALTVQHS